MYREGLGAGPFAKVAEVEVASFSAVGLNAWGGRFPRVAYMHTTAETPRHLLLLESSLRMDYVKTFMHQVQGHAS